MRHEIEMGHDGPGTVRIRNPQADVYVVFEMGPKGLMVRRSEGANKNTIAVWKELAQRAFDQRDAA